MADPNVNRGRSGLPNFRDGTGRFREIRVPNFRNDGTVTEILTSGITENLTCLKTGITENRTLPIMIGRMVILHREGRGYCRNWGGAAQCACALDVLAEVLILQTHHAMEKPEPYCRRYLAFKPEEAESILRGADDDDPRICSAPPVKPRGFHGL